jgi:hypothetical protein
MAIERQNSVSSKLEGLDQIPEGFEFDRNATWKKINAMRSSKPKKRVALFAAVLIPLALAISWIFIRDKRGDDKVVITVPASRTESLERLITTSKGNDIVQKNFSKQGNVKASPGRSEKNAATMSQQTKKVVIVEPSIIDIPAEEVTAAAPSPDTVAVVASTKPKYKYRIAHINEINDVQAQPSNVIAQKIVKKPFLASVTTVPAADEDKIVQKKKYPFPFLSNPIQ